MLKITKYLTPCNFTKMTNKKIEYLVIHYVGAVSSAKNNAVYYHSKRAASANYFVDETTIYQVVEDTDRAWHCGGGLQGATGTHPFYKICTNANSIGIEMCLDRIMHISDKTIENVADLVQMLMNKYDIPVTKVITHHLVTSKLCPAMYVDEDKWDELKKILVGAKVPTPVKIITKSPIVAPTKTSTLNTWTKRLQKAIHVDIDGMAGRLTLSKCPQLQYGDKGEVVKLLQEKLRITIDSDFGNKTKSAVKVYQKKNGLVADGVFGEASWRKLLGLK